MSCGFDDGTQMTLSGRMNADFFYFFVVQYSIVILKGAKRSEESECTAQPFERMPSRSFANAQDDKERGSTQDNKAEKKICVHQQHLCHLRAIGEPLLPLMKGARGMFHWPCLQMLMLV